MEATESNTKQRRATNVNTALLAIANAVIAAIVVPALLYVAATTIDTAKAVAEMRGAAISRTEIELKLEQLRAEITAIKVQVVTLEQVVKQKSP